MDQQQDVTELLDAITWGRRIVEVYNGQGNKVTYVMRPLTLEERNMGNYIYKRAKDDALTRGLLSRDDLTKQAIEQQLWKSAYQDDFKALRNELAQQLKERDYEERTKMLDSKGRPKRQSPTPKLKKINKKIAYISETIRHLDTIYTQFIELPSVEYQAECERGSYFLRCAALSFPEMQQVWSSLDELNNEEDTHLVGNLMRAYYNESIADDAAIRRVARSGFWRCKWIASKKNRGVRTLFDREMFDLTMDQFRLVHWSLVYDSAFESMDAPSDKVIEDDKLFDRWLEEQHQKREKERKQSAFDKKISKLDKKGNANEVGFSVQGEFCQECTCGVKTQAEARGADKRGHMHDPSCPYGVFLYYDRNKKQTRVEDIQSTNPDSVRKLHGSEQKRLAAAGSEGVEEQYLRGDKARSALGMETKYHSKGEINKQTKGRALS